MEESVKRRERLKAMRTEASNPGVCNDVSGSTPSHSLANPLIETHPAVQGESTPRFDYYTDPMSAFSGNKSRSKVSNQILPEHCTTPRPIYQAPPNYSPDQSMYQSQGPYHNPAHFRSPGPSPYQSQGPYNNPTHFRSPGPSPYQSQGPYHNPTHFRSPGPSPYQSQGPHHNPAQFGSPMRMTNPLGTHQQTPPPRGGNFSSPNFTSSGRGRGPRFSNSPSPSSGGRGGGRRGGPGSRENVSAEFRPDLYYNKSMVEDPWKDLKPVVWKKLEDDVAKYNINTPDSRKSWLPESLRQKKPKVSDGPPNGASSSQPSLAEYLAASFNEAANNEESVND